MYEAKHYKTVRQNKTEIGFDKVAHAYTVGGKTLPSVSAIMRELSKDYYADVDPILLKKSALRGTMVHEAIQMYEEFGAVAQNDEINQYLIQYKIAKRIYKFEVLECEVMLTNGEYCGIMDQFALFRGNLIMIDHKTTAKINQDLISVQFAGYKELAEYNGFPVEHCFVLLLKKDGFKFTEIEPNVLVWSALKERYHNGNKDVCDLPQDF
jgi:hypothetical protein